MKEFVVFWDGRRLHAWDALGEEIAGQSDVPVQEDGDHGEESGQTDVPSWGAFAEQPPPDMLIWSVERLLSRPFSLPLAHPRLLDMDILGQELAGQAGIEPDDWWLSWQAEAVENGVAGLVFGMPTTVQAGLAADATWQACRVVCVDAWLRLTTLVPEDHAEGFAVFDADAEGLFAGVYHGGVWRGMRRMNLASGCTCAAIAKDAIRSVLAMGFTPDAMPVYGRLDATWHSELVSDMDWRGEVVESLPDRATATHLAASHADVNSVPNFRHGAWAVSGDWQKRLQPWRRTAVLAALLLLMMLGGNFYRVHRLHAEQADIQVGIEAAFHRGLPDEKVMLDPLAQLRKAAGGGAASDTWFFLRQLQAVGQLKQKIKGLRIASMQYTGKDMQLSGTVLDLASVNRIRDTLSSILGHQVDVEDTELADKQVRFRIKWAGAQP